MRPERGLIADSCTLILGGGHRREDHLSAVQTMIICLDVYCGKFDMFDKRPQTVIQCVVGVAASCARGEGAGHLESHLGDDVSL